MKHDAAEYLHYCRRSKIVRGKKLRNPFFATTVPITDEIISYVFDKQEKSVYCIYCCADLYFIGRRKSGVLGRINICQKES